MATKTQLVDFLYHNFRFKLGKKLTKKDLSRQSKEHLEQIVIDLKCEVQLTAWINKPKRITFYANCEQEEYDAYTFKISALSIEEAKLALEDDGYKVVKIVPKKGNTLCKYCGAISEGPDVNLLCEDCRMYFGHTFYYEL